MLLTELIKHEYKSRQDDKSNSEKLFLCINNIYNQNMKTVNSYVFIDLGYYKQIIFGFIRTNNFIQMLWVI